MEDTPQIISNLLDNRPVRWAENTIGGYDGCERTLEVFNADAAEQLELLRRIRQQVSTLLVVVFHTRSETTRLYKDFIQTWNNEIHWVDQEVKLGENKPHREIRFVAKETLGEAIINVRGLKRLMVSHQDEKE